MLRDPYSLDVVLDDEGGGLVFIAGFRAVDVVDLAVSFADSDHSCIIIKVNPNGLIGEQVTQAVFGGVVHPFLDVDLIDGLEIFYLVLEGGEHSSSTTIAIPLIFSAVRAAIRGCGGMLIGSA